MSDFGETKVNLGVFWPSECDANIWFAPESFNIHLQNISSTGLMANFSRKIIQIGKKLQRGRWKITTLKIKCTDLKWSYQFCKSGLRVLVCKKKLPQFWLLPNIGEFIVNSPNRRSRHNDKVSFGSRRSQYLWILQIQVEVLKQLWSWMASDDNLPELWYHVRIWYSFDTM